MAKFDPKKYGYHNLMHPEAGAVSYPDELKGDTWRKEKGKLCPETGLGKLLDKCEVAFKGVTWESFNATTIDKLDAETERLLKWIKGPDIKKYSDALKDVAVLAKAKAAELKKAKLVPKAAGEAAQKVFDAADWLTVTLNINSMGGMLDEAREACKKVRLAAALKTAGQNITAARDVRNKLAAELKTIKAELDKWNASNGEAQLKLVGGPLRDLCRDMTQPLGNLLKAEIAGAGYQQFNQQAVTVLFKEMSVISNTSSWTKSYADFDKNQMETEYERVKQWGTRFSTLTSPVAMP
ncbi:MAG: hypothetical protein K8U03_02875 [Planctomycetia bacterium]|nr:hypothetical protein [Planctomycetia bacterium]